MEPLGVTDFHTHAFPDELAPRAMQAIADLAPGEARPCLDGTVGDLVRSMDEAGIGRSVICSIATAPRQVAPILAWSLRIRSDRIVPFGSVHPECEGASAEGSGAEVLRIAESGLLGLKLHPQYQNFALDEERMWPVYEAIAACGLILVLHAGADMAFPLRDDRADPRRLMKVHEAFPTIPIIAAHMGGWMRWREVADVLAGTGVCLETSYTLHMAEPDVMAAILERHSIGRILFGSDSPWRGQAETMELVRRTWPDEADQRKVLRENADRLLREAAGRVAPHV
jgi:hypothetical protein